MILHSIKAKYFLFFCLFFLIGTQVQAQSLNTVAFSVSPSIFDMTANPGQSFQTSIRVINGNPYDLELYIDTANFVPRAESGVPEFIPVSEFDQETTFATWIKTPEKVTVPAEKTIELPITVMVPNNGDPGGHFAAILIGTRPPLGDDGTQVSTAQIISSLLFLRVTGDVTETAFIRSFRTTDFFLSKPATTFELRIENKGNVHVRPEGKITIYNMWGQERGEVFVNQKTLFGNVLPQSIRKSSFEWESEWSIADIGRYTAKVVLSYGLNERYSLVSQTSFWVVPWKWVLVSLLVIGLFFYGFATAIKVYIRRALSLSGVQPAAFANSKGVSLTPKVKKFNLIAPFEVGMLDLRSELGKSTSNTERLKTLGTFAVRYWKFFALLVGIILFAFLIAWYMGQGAESRNFTVITDTGEKVTNETLAPGAKDRLPLPVNEKVAVKMVNRSGSEAAVKSIRNRIENADFRVSTVEEEEIQDRTVIVFSPSLTDEALRLSALLKNAPLSALPEATDDAPELTVFLGRDAVANTE